MLLSSSLGRFQVKNRRLFYSNGFTTDVSIWWKEKFFKILNFLVGAHQNRTNFWHFSCIITKCSVKFIPINVLNTCGLSSNDIDRKLVRYWMGTSQSHKIIKNLERFIHWIYQVYWLSLRQYFSIKIFFWSKDDKPFLWFQCFFQKYM